MRTLAILVLAAAPLAALDGPSPEITIQQVQGEEVEFRTDSKSPWEAAAPGKKLRAGSQVCTGVSSEVILSFGDGSAAIVRELSMLTVIAFELRGDELIAQVKINPGVCEVSVKELPQYRTNFEVSTPRLTASVRGSVGHFEAYGDEVPDVADSREGTWTMGTGSGQGRTLTQGAASNSNNAAPVDVATAGTLASISPVGATINETGNTYQWTFVNEGAEVISSDLSPQRGTGRPEGGGGGPPPPVLPTSEHDLGHLVLDLAEVGRHVQFDPIGQGNEADLVSWHETLHEESGGARVMVDRIIQDAHDDLHADPAGLGAANAALFAAREADFHDDGSGLGFDAWSANTRTLADASHLGTVPEAQTGQMMIAAENVSWHQANYALPEGDFPGSYDHDHALFHSQVIDPLAANLATQPFGTFVQGYQDTMDDLWHANMGVEQNPSQQDPIAPLHNHLHDTLDKVDNDAASATGN